MSIQTLDTLEELETHIDALITLEPKFAPVHQQVGTPSLRRNTGGFEQLLRAIVGQQLSVAAASSIWQRLHDANLTSAPAIIQADDETLRAQGLSKQKVRYARALATHKIDYTALESMSDDDVIEILTGVTGIGRWTAEMYLLFSLGRADVLAVDDLAIRVGAMSVLGLDARPTPKHLLRISEAWAPYRSASSLLIWAYYSTLRAQQSVPL